MRVRKSICLLFACSSLLLGANACKPAPSIRIGISAWAGVEPAELAARQGFYAQRGVQVEMVRFSAYTDSIQAFREGRVDVDMQTFDDAMRLFADGKGMKLVLFTDYSYGGDGIVAKSDIHSVAELKGKRVGVEIGTVGHFSLLKALETAGLSEKDITMVSIPAWDIKEAFVAGKIDAGVTWEPYLTSMATDGSGRVIITSRDYPKTITTSMVMSDELLQTRRDDAAKIVAAFFDGLDYLRQHPNEAYATLAQAEGISTQDFATQAGEVHFIDLAENQRSFGRNQDGDLFGMGRNLASFLYHKGMIKSQINVAGLLNGDFVNALH